MPKLTKEEKQLLQELAAGDRKHELPFDTLEEMFTSPEGFGLVSATPLQRAICRLADGVPLGDLAAHPDVVQCIGNAPPDITRPRELAILAGVRTGKSLLAAAIAVWASQTCNMYYNDADGKRHDLQPGDIPRVSVLSVTIDLARQVFNHLRMTLMHRPRLSPLLMGEPQRDTVMLRHPSGRAVEIKVIAGAKAGGSVVARWSAGCIFDEYARMSGSDDGVVNYRDTHTSVIDRLLPGAQIISISSPWGRHGPAFETYEKYYKKPSNAYVFVQADARKLNPAYWTAERCEQLQERDPDAYVRSVLGAFLSGDDQFFPSQHITAAIRTSPIMRPPQEGVTYRAAMDPATRDNDWTLVIGALLPGGKRSIVYHKRWKGTQANPLKPSKVLREIAGICKKYNVGMIDTDQYSGDAMRDLGESVGLVVNVKVWTRKNQYEAFRLLKLALGESIIELPPDPLVRADFDAVRQIVTRRGIGIVFPLTPDGRHCDYAPAIAMCLAEWLDEPKEAKADKGSDEYWQQWQDKMLDKALKGLAHENRMKKEWGS
jgi:hypothetical protein